MISSILLIAIAMTYFAFSAWAMIKPNSLQRLLGYQTLNASGQNEFFAIYGGVFFGKAMIAVLALATIDPLLVVTVFLLLIAQPFGRVVAIIHHNSCSGIMKCLGWAEFIGASLLLGAFLLR